MSAVTNRLTKTSRRDEATAWLFVTPQLIGLLCFVVVPFCFAVYLCFCKWNFLKPPVWVGLDNFKEVFVFDWPIFGKTLFNMLVYLVGIIPLTLIVSMILALLCKSKTRFLNFFKGAYFLPMVTSSVSMALVWYWMYAPGYGIINFLLQNVFGIANGPGWLQDKSWARLAVIIMTTWSKTGYYFIILLSGLHSIDMTYYEAARIDGAGSWSEFWKITMPMLSPVLLFVCVMLAIDVFNIFSNTYILTRGGPNFSTNSIVMYIYNKAFVYFNMGEASVASIVLFLLAGATTFLQVRIQGRRVNYDA